MQEIGDVVVLSPSDLNGFLACPHHLTSSSAWWRGGVARPRIDDPDAEALVRRGDEYERARRAKPDALRQLCAYSEQAARLQGRIRSGWR
jgi:hypothetical protein